MTARPSVRFGPDDPLPLERAEGIVRIGDLAEWRRDLWWHFPDPPVERPGDLEALMESLQPMTADVAAAQAEPRVRAALATFVELGLPHLETLARLRCGG